MKNYISQALVIVAIANPSYILGADSDYCSALKLRGSAFIPQAALFKNIYGNAAGVVDLELSTQVYDHVSVWANVDVFCKRGHALGFGSPTKITMSHISLGFKFPYDVNTWATVYLGAGANFGALWLKNKSIYCCEKVFQPAGGIVVKSGADFFITDRCFIDIFVDYLYQPTHFDPRRINTGGTKVGFGIGSTF